MSVTITLSSRTRRFAIGRAVSESPSRCGLEPLERRMLLSSALPWQQFSDSPMGGPIPGQEQAWGGYYRASEALSGGATKIISGVPAYFWHHGCGPTAAGMVVGYWDAQGYENLVAGDAAAQSAAVNNMMASPDHYNDYSLPMDGPGTGVLPDRSSLGGAHASNCVADFMATSWSSYSLYYGWSFYSQVEIALDEYAGFAGYPEASSYSEIWGDFTWADFTAEIDANRPMVFLVDSDTDGVTDHFVTAIGYDPVNNDYAAYNTWDSSVHWYDFAQMSRGQPFGIFGATYFDPGMIENQFPYKGTPFVVGGTPVTIQAEDFDLGGEGISYHDVESKNFGGKYRTSEGVDIQPTNDVGGGDNIGWVKAGEWLEYTIDVAATGKYDFAFRLASAGINGQFHVEIDGVDASGVLTVPKTGLWQNWTTLTKSGVALEQGKHVLRLAMDAVGSIGSVGNFNWMKISLSPMRINYQLNGSPKVPGYEQDNGVIFGDRGNGLTYGWNKSYTSEDRDRNRNVNQLLDTLVHMRSGATWKISVPNGGYNVKLSVGDAQYTSDNTVNINGVSYWNRVALGINAFANKTSPITVSDGEIVIDSIGALDRMTKLNYIEITPAT